MATGPKNIVHISQSDIEAGRTKHVTLDEILRVAANTQGLGTVSFENSEISTTAIDSGSFLSFKIGDDTYKIKLYQ